MSKIILNDQNFLEEVLKSDQPVLVDFWAEWCMPCQMMNPIINDLSQEFEGKIKIGKLNVDDAPNIASSFRIDAIPTLILFKNGKIFKKIIGVQTKESIRQIINDALTTNQ